MTQPVKVAAVGEILVEMVAKTRGQGFRETQEIVGPFPSGAPAIFIDQVAKMGLPCTIFGAVGDDDFGRINLDRLAADGVDVSNIALRPGLPTGIAFVRYRTDGGRDFLYTLRGSASEQTPETATPQALEGITHLHIMGSGLGVPRIAGFVEAAADIVKANGGTISLDPNLRPELIAPKDQDAVLGRLRRLAAISAFLLPSEGETAVLTEGADDFVRIGKLLEQGMPEIVLKRGAAGASVFFGQTRMDVPAPKVEEIDPTGAGDCFGATYIAMRLSGHAPELAARYAVAAGAHMVTRFGPMEGTITRAELDRKIMAG